MASCGCQPDLTRGRDTGEMPHWRALYNCGRRAPVSRGRLYAPADILAMVDVDAQDPPKAPAERADPPHYAI